MTLTGTVVECNINERGPYSRVKLLDPADGLTQRFNIEGAYPVGSKVEVVVMLPGEHTMPLAASDAVGVTRG